MPFVKTYIHFVWSTKNREKSLRKDLRVKIFNHIKENAKKKDIYIDFIGGYTDHIHILVSLGIDQTISDIMRLIKGESSYWINKNKLFPYKFEWQNEYYAVSVCQSILNDVRNYIKNQEEHHRYKSFQEEVEEFMKKYEFGKFG